MLANRKQFKTPRRKFFYLTKICHKFDASPFFRIKKNSYTRERKIYMQQKSVINCMLQPQKKKRHHDKKSYETVFFESSITLTRVNTLDSTFFDQFAV